MIIVSLQPGNEVSEAGIVATVPDVDRMEVKQNHRHPLVGLCQQAVRRCAGFTCGQ